MAAPTASGTVPGSSMSEILNRPRADCTTTLQAELHHFAYKMLVANLLARAFQILALVTFSASSSAQTNDVPSVRFLAASSEETVHRWSTDRCNSKDTPDMSARAFRDTDGKIHLIASDSRNRAMIGTDFNNLTKDCRTIYSTSRSGEPSRFDDEGWLESFHTEDGVNVFALVSMDYHPYRHSAACGTSPTTRNDCWYSTIVFARSRDKGYSFVSPSRGGDRFVAGSSSRFDPKVTSPVGAFVPSNVVKMGGLYYFLLSVASHGEQRGGECALRSADLYNVKAWRAWGGSDFDVTFNDPYSAPAAAVSKPCAILNSIPFSPIRSLSRIGNMFVAVSYDPGNPAMSRGSGVVAQLSRDLLRWSPPTTIMNLPIYTPNKGPAGAIAYYYPSLIDHGSGSLNFDTVGSSAYLYLTKYRYGMGENRDLVRFRINVNAQ